ncbi:MAG: hypothetical protein IJZ62_04790 [Clostridia bacterium]|nr:hypothetical protein [Clostridia bacterium]
MLIEKLRPEELGMMDTWRRWHAWSNESTSRNGTYAEMASILHEWDIRKSEYLAKLFGGELKITKHLNYKKSYEELQEELSDMTQEHSHYGRVGRNGYEFMKAWNNYMYKNRFSFTDDQENGFRRLMSDDCLISNTYDGYSFEVDTREGKKFRINRGCKTSKALGKLADIFDLPGWEDFRICHSQILNQRDLGGDLTISIHPLDYMTMSDNTYGWESCMSWEQEGGYRQGTVEMMNSRSVVVAYLSGNDGMRIGDDYWNSKKWRQLFVVDHNVIAGVKDYPYHNEDLGLEVVKWLKELAAKNLNWHYKDIIAFGFEGERVHLDYLPDEKNDFNLDFQNGAMYNDFGCLDHHWMCFSTNIDPDEIHGSNQEWRNTYLPIHYSGSSQCMICGELCPDMEDESCLACESCQDRLRCDCCGEIASETWTIDGIQLCESCYENRVHECMSCGEEHYDENMSPIFVIPRIDPKFQENLRDHWLDSNGYWGCGFAHSRSELEQAEYNFFKDENPNGWICADEKKCLEKWVEMHLKPGERPHLREWRWTKEICVYLDQLNEDGVYDLAYGFENDNEGYINSFRDYQCQPTRFIELL